MYYLTNSISEVLHSDNRLSGVISKARTRTVFTTILGKSIVLLRDMESDLNDFLSNLCIHYVESKKLRRKLKIPKILHTLTQTKDIGCLPLTNKEAAEIQEL